MRTNRLSIGLRATLTIFAVTLLVTSTWAATEKILHRFNNNGKDGFFPYAGLIFDAAGNLYGTTTEGGDSTKCVNGCGTVFELTPQTGGGWREKILHNFNGTDGANPHAGLIFDAAGNLYGTTTEGGDSTTCVNGCGTVFELMPTAGGRWMEKVLHSFNGTDGAAPYAGLIFDVSGNLYSTTAFGGGGSCIYSGYVGCGTVFELTPEAGAGWKEKILHRFNNNGRDGIFPYANLILDAAGNLYGTTYETGVNSCDPSGCGVVFELTPQTGGAWRKKILHNFNGVDGAGPYAGLIFDVSGNLYGTTSGGGIYDGGVGTVFELTPKTGGGWTEKVLHNFNYNGTDGIWPYASLVFDASGNLYGTTSQGGFYEVGGIVFELTLQTGGGWREKILYNFNDGPYASLIFDASGNLYGTTSTGGGTVYEVRP